MVREAQASLCSVAPRSRPHDVCARWAAASGIRPLYPQAHPVEPHASGAALGVPLRLLLVLVHKLAACAGHGQRERGPPRSGEEGEAVCVHMAACGGCATACQSSARRCAAPDEAACCVLEQGPLRPSAALPAAPSSASPGVLTIFTAFDLV